MKKLVISFAILASFTVNATQLPSELRTVTDPDGTRRMGAWYYLNW
jgi:hypothetical protein